MEIEKYDSENDIDKQTNQDFDNFKEKLDNMQFSKNIDIKKNSNIITEKILIYL